MTLERDLKGGRQEDAPGRMHSLCGNLEWERELWELGRENPTAHFPVLGHVCQEYLFYLMAKARPTLYQLCET